MGHYVYKYVLNGEIIYIGKNDTDLHSRIATHGKRGDNIPEEGWSEINAATIYYIKLANSTMSDVVESELIRKYKPKYNVAKKSDWTGLPFVEPEWIKYKPENQKSKNKKIKQIKENQIEKDDWFKANQTGVKFMHYIYDCIFKKDFFITQERKNNYKFIKEYRDEYDLFIRMPDWYNGTGEENLSFKWHPNGGFRGYSLFSSIQRWPKYFEGDEYWVNYSAIFSKDHMLFKSVEAFYGAFLANSIKTSNDRPDIPEELETLYDKSQTLKENWDTYIDINDKNTWREPPEDPGKNIKQYNDKTAKRNNNFFWKWYEGCTMIYTDGKGYHIYKDKHFSKYICNYDESFRLGSDKRDLYFLEEYINYYFFHWAVELDNVIWITSLGSVFCGDFYGTFLSTADEYGLRNMNAAEDVRRAVEVIAKNRIKHGVGKKH